MPHWKVANLNAGYPTRDDQFAQLFAVLNEYHIVPKQPSFKPPLIERIMEIFDEE